MAPTKEESASLILEIGCDPYTLGVKSHFAKSSACVIPSLGTFNIVQFMAFASTIMW